MNIIFSDNISNSLWRIQSSLWDIIFLCNLQCIIRTISCVLHYLDVNHLKSVSFSNPRVKYIFKIFLCLFKNIVLWEEWVCLDLKCYLKVLLISRWWHYWKVMLPLRCGPTWGKLDHCRKRLYVSGSVFLHPLSPFSTHPLPCPSSSKLLDCIHMSSFAPLGIP